MKNCNQCGKCCIKYSNGGLSATTEEIEWWETFRPEIYRYIKDGKIWVDPDSGRELTYCPWLKEDAESTGSNPSSSSLNQPIKYTCSIYHDRPEDCRQYPSLIEEMVRDGCEMIEAVDLKRPREAQKRLNIIRTLSL